MPKSDRRQLPGCVPVRSTFSWLGAVLIVMCVACSVGDVKKPWSTDGGDGGDGGDEAIADGDIDTGAEDDSSLQPELTSIEISPSLESLRVGDTQQFIAVPRDSNGNVMQVTITWSSSDTIVGSIDGTGLFSAKAAGTTTITAESGLIAGKLTVFCSNYYYVSALTGDDANTGTSEAEAWRTIAHAATRAQAGDTVFVQGGNYGHEHVVFSNSGAAGNPIVFRGYNGVPVIDGQDQTGSGFYLRSKSYVEIRNFKVTRYEDGLFADRGTYIVMEDIVAEKFGGHEQWDGNGVFLNHCDYCIVRNVDVTDACMDGIYVLYSNFCLVENCNVYSVASGVGLDNPTDYYIIIGWGHDNTIRNCLVHNKHGAINVHSGHGIGIKDNPSWTGTHSYNNKITNCVSRAMGEHFFVSHLAHDNEFSACVAYRDDSVAQWNSGLVSRDGAHHNNFKKCSVDGTEFGISFSDTGEADAQTMHDNIIENCIITNSSIGVFYHELFETSDISENTIDNCTFSKSKYLFRLFGDIHNNSIKNSIFVGIADWATEYASWSPGTSKIDITYSDFWDNGFATPAATGNIEEDPLLADPAAGDFHLRSQAGRWNGTSWVNDTSTSPCIGAGDPSSDNSQSPWGGIVEMGAFGNTAEASKP